MAHSPVIRIAAGKAVQFNVTPEVRRASGRRLAYPTRPGVMTGRKDGNGLAEVNFGPDPESDKDFLDWVLPCALIPA